jgi:hypothetical protein
LVHILGDVHGVGASPIIDDWSTGTGFIKIDTKEVADNFRFIGPPSIPRDLYDLMDRYERAISEVFGINEVVTGSDPGASKNARHAQYIDELDGQKLGTARRNLDSALLRTDRQCLRLYQQYVKAPRLVEIGGPTSAVGVREFVGTELDGIDLKLEPAPGIAMQRFAQARDAEEQGAAGQLDPAAAAERRQTGLPVTMDQGAARMTLQLQVAQALTGQPVEPDPTVDPSMGLAVVREAIASYASLGAQRLMPLRALAQSYAEQMQAAQMQGQQPPQQGAVKATPQAQPLLPPKV